MSVVYLVINIAKSHLIFEFLHKLRENVSDYGLPESKILFWESLLYALSNEV